MWTDENRSRYSRDGLRYPETHRNIEVIWLLRHLKPVFKRVASIAK
jgi:hypothetical protein